MDFAIRKKIIRGALTIVINYIDALLVIISYINNFLPKEQWFMKEHTTDPICWKEAPC